MARNQYFSHTSPTYGSAFAMLKAAGCSYKTAGENIAMGQKDAASVMDGLDAFFRTSREYPAHELRKNRCRLCGFRVTHTPYWVQIFAG